MRRGVDSEVVSMRHRWVDGDVSGKDPGVEEVTYKTPGVGVSTQHRALQL